MVLIHDLPESVCGDITPEKHSRVSKERKQKIESKALDTICEQGFKHNPQLGQHIKSLWEEYEDGQSVESMIAKDLDKLEMIITASEYEEEHGVDLEEFFESTKDQWKTEVVSRMAKDVCEQRNLLKRKNLKLNEKLS